MTYEAGSYDCIVVGAGHAGCEAALAAARMGCRTLIVTLNMENIGLMPCNPSIGGPAKGHLVREIDALGGEMGLNIDATYIQMRMLNTGKGPAVYALRAQADKEAYQKRMTAVLQGQEGLDVKQLLVERILVNSENRIQGIETENGAIYRAGAVILCTGTYLRGKIIIGDHLYTGGPNGQRAAQNLSANLRELGLELGRFKTGTPARVDCRSLDYTKMQIQPGDREEHFFSFLTQKGTGFNIPCHLTYTNHLTHKVIHENIHRSPLYSGKIEGIGPRYCPSIEDKVMRFADKERHQLFLEPEGLNTKEVYVQGMSSSLPEDVQMAFLRTIRGMEQVEMMRTGYAIEYDYLPPMQLKLSLETKKIHGLFTAGQMNGTSGYEEAAAQGIMAGINAALLLKGRDPLILKRSEAYIGVLIDDLVTKGTNEPYRMMTSRAEYRLLLRQDNADLRLTEKGWDIGLVKEQRYQKLQNKKTVLHETIKMLKNTVASPADNKIQELLESRGSSKLKHGISIYELLRRAEVNYEVLAELEIVKRLPWEVEEQINIQIKYEGYIEKQQSQVERFERIENRILPDWLDYHAITGLSNEARQKMSRLKPTSIGQAARISGVSPADINVLLITLEQARRKADQKDE